MPLPGVQSKMGLAQHAVGSLSFIGGILLMSFSGVAFSPAGPHCATENQALAVNPKARAHFETARSRISDSRASTFRLWSFCAPIIFQSFASIITTPRRIIKVIISILFLSLSMGQREASLSIYHTPAHWAQCPSADSSNVTVPWMLGRVLVCRSLRREQTGSPVKGRRASTKSMGWMVFSTNAICMALAKWSNEY